MATGYPAVKGAGRLRGQRPYLDYPKYRTALTRRRAELMLSGSKYLERASNPDICKTTIVAGEEAAVVIAAT